MRFLFLCVLLSCLLFHANGALGSDTLDFSQQVLPILSDKCFVCHGPDAQDEEGLRLDSYDGATEDRGGYKAIDPASPADSELLARIHSEDDPMPPEEAEKQLTDAEREVLSQWVQQGGKYAKHWSFVPPRRQFDLKSIDQFIGQKLASKQTDFAAEAEPSTLARRAALILTGLPPEPEQLHAFLADPSADAYEEFVDALLASPRFGEHQARYWLDAVRYGDTHGLHLDNRRGIYPYRDWVVKAFNDNLPLDDFITWQLAGDLLPQPTLEQLTATGFVRMNPSTSEGGAIAAEFQAKNNFDRVETLGTVLLGLSLTCARCHTHKYDPIPQTEYYRLMAFFNSTAESAMDGNKYEYRPVLRVPQDQAAWAAWQAYTSDRDVLLDNVDPSCVESSQFAAWSKDAPEPRLAALADPQGPFADLGVHAKAKALTERKNKLESGFTTTLVAKDLDKPRPTYILRRGEYDQPQGDPVDPGTLSVVGELPPGAPQNRLGLAQWLTSDTNPLVARVLVNRIWQRVFGFALVRSTEDFGVQGQQPTHPELLDWLSVELQESGWNLKQMLRRMVLSRTFRQRSAWRTEFNDPENRFFARASSYRLDAEVLRDIGLWSSNLLDPHMGGEGVKPYQPSGMWMAMAHPASNTKKYQRDEGQRLYRRSLYVYWKRTSPHPMMTIFDAPDRESSCVRRSRTNTSLQSLGLLNETQRIEMSRKLAERLLKEADTTDGRLDLLFTLLACREPNASERAACGELLLAARQRYRANEEDAQSLLAVGDAQADKSLNSVEAAAWTQVTSTVLASDLALVLY